MKGIIALMLAVLVIVGLGLLVVIDIDKRIEHAVEAVHQGQARQ